MPMITEKKVRQKYHCQMLLESKYYKKKTKVHVALPMTSLL